MRIPVVVSNVYVMMSESHRSFHVFVCVYQLISVCLSDCLSVCLCVCVCSEHTVVP